LYAENRGQVSLILLGNTIYIGVGSVLSIDDMWISTSSQAFKVGMWFILCLSLEYLLTLRPCFWCWKHCSSVYSRIVFRSSVEYHFEGRIQLSCSVQFPRVVVRIFWHLRRVEENLAKCPATILLVFVGFANVSLIR
jgi:hypothetical protein